MANFFPFFLPISFRLSQLPSSSSNGNSDSGDFFSSLRDRVYLIRPFARNPFTRYGATSSLIPFLHYFQFACLLAICICICIDKRK